MFPEFGKGAELSKDQQTSIHKIIDILEEKKILSQSKVHSKYGVICYLKCEKTIDWIMSPAFPSIVLDEVVQTQFAEILTKSDTPLYSTLLKYRQRVASERGDGANNVIPLNSIRKIAKDKPMTMEALGAIPGMTHDRLAQYGMEILSIVAKSENQESVQATQSPYFNRPAATRQSQVVAPNSVRTPPAPTFSPLPLTPSPIPGEQPVTHELSPEQHLEQLLSTASQNAGNEGILRLLAQKILPFLQVNR